MICNKCKNKFEYDEGEKDVCYECIEESKGCNKMFKPFGDSKEETSWKCGDKWNGESLLCSECKKLNEQRSKK